MTQAVTAKTGATSTRQVVELCDVSMRFGGKQALDNVSPVFEFVSAPKLCLFVLVVAAIPAFAQTPSELNSQLSPQARQVHGVAVPVPKEIFRSLDQFQDANWRAVKRPEVARWKSHGNPAQIATLLGVVIAEGFIAMEAEDSTEVKDLGRTVLALARGLGVEDRALRRSRSIMELANKNEWTAARQEWDGVLSDIEDGMIELKSTRACPTGKCWRMVARHRGALCAGASEIFTRAFRPHSATGSD